MDGVGWGPGFVPQATALWRWSNYLQHMDPPDKIRVLINVDETSVRLVPQEGKGHVSKGAYRLLCSGADVGKSMLEEIAQLKKQQKEAKDAKLAVGKQLRNAERRRKRLKKRASKLSDADLLAVISLRNHEKAVGGQGDTATDKGDEENAKRHCR